MKTLYLIRHAKSSWDDFNLTDRQRPLNERGLRDAARMASLWASKSPSPDRLISSPAVRAHTTAGFFAEALGRTNEDIELNPLIYEASVETILHIIKELSADWDTVCLFGHNPTFTDIANLFPGASIDNVPTCGIVHLSSSAESWQDFSKHNTRIAEFTYPKQ